jgi:hypothetical protein
MLGLACRTASPQTPLTITTTPSADAFVRSFYATNNYGGAGALSVSGAAAANGLDNENGVFVSLIRFPVADVVSGFDAALGESNWTITGARLLLSEVAAPNDVNFNRGLGTFFVWWMADDSWVEGTGNARILTGDGVTFNDLDWLLPDGSFALLGTFANEGANTQQSFNLDLDPQGFVQDLMGGGEVSFFLSPNSPYAGFTFRARNRGGPTVPVLEITAVPNEPSRPPVMDPVSVGTPMNTPLVLSKAKLLGKASDPDGNALFIFEVSSTSTNGSTVQADALAISYTPAPNYVGQDRFSFILCDGWGGFLTNTVDVTVTPGNTMSLNMARPPEIVGSNFQASFAGIPGRTYTIEWKETLEGSWRKLTNLAGPTSGSGAGLIRISEPTGGATSRFYRTVYPAY